MIYKIFYQEKVFEVPVREKTKAIYIEASSEMDVRKKLAAAGYNIEFIQPIEGEFLNYEQQNEYFKVENV